MKIKRATSDEDFKEIQDFIEEQDIPPPPARIKNRFAQGYQKFLEMLGPENESWILENNGKVSATGTLNFKKMVIEGVEQSVALTSFMRVRPDAKSTLLWTKHLLPTFSESLKKRNCKYIFSFVFYSFRSDIKNFRQAIKLRDDMPRYYLIRKANYTNIHGRLPWRSKALKSIHVKMAKVGDIPQILDFLQKQQLDRKLTHPWDFEQLRKIIENAQDERSAFWIAIDTQAKVVGCFQPLEISKFREDIVTEVTPDVQNYFYIQKILSWLKMAAPSPKFGKPLPTLYLTHIEATNQDIFETLLRYAYKFLRKKKEIISYTHFSGNLITRPPKCFMHGSLPMDFYLILPPQQDPPDFLKAYWMAPVPEFEALYF